MNSPTPRRRSARRVHRPFHGSAVATVVPRLDDPLRLLDFRTAGFVARGWGVGSTLSTPGFAPSLSDGVALCPEAATWYRPEP
jgi:hypothetical protein